MQQVEGTVDTSTLEPGVAAVIRSAIAYEKDKRPETGLAFADALESENTK